MTFLVTEVDTEATTADDVARGVAYQTAVIAVTQGVVCRLPFFPFFFTDVISVFTPAWFVLAVVPAIAVAIGPAVTEAVGQAIDAAFGPDINAGVGHVSTAGPTAC